MIEEIKLPGDILLDEEYQRNDNIWVVKDKLVIEMSKT